MPVEADKLLTVVKLAGYNIKQFAFYYEIAQFLQKGGLGYSVEGFLRNPYIQRQSEYSSCHLIKVCKLVCCHRFPRKEPMLVLRYIVHQVSFQGRKDTFLEYFTNFIQERYRTIVITGTRKTFLQLWT